jgi:hypothetical protein
MPAIVRKSDRSRIAGSIGTAPLAEVANVEKKLPRDYISRPTVSASRQGRRRYLAPLIAGRGLPALPDGLPAYVTLKRRGRQEEAAKVRR